jgi:hypothetical protein
MKFVAKDSQVCDSILQASDAGNRVESTWLLPLQTAEATSQDGQVLLPEQPMQFEQGFGLRGRT